MNHFQKEREKGKYLLSSSARCSLMSVSQSSWGRYCQPYWAERKLGFQRSDNIFKFLHLVKCKKSTENPRCFCHTMLPKVPNLWHFVSSLRYWVFPSENGVDWKKFFVNIRWFAELSNPRGDTELQFTYTIWRKKGRIEPVTANRVSTLYQRHCMKFNYKQAQIWKECIHCLIDSSIYFLR